MARLRYAISRYMMTSQTSAVLLLLTALLFCVGFVHAEGDEMMTHLSSEYVVLSKADRLLSATQVPPPESEHWQLSVLPDSWNLARDRGRDENISWYRLLITPELHERYFADGGEKLSGIMVYRHLMSVDVYFNHDYLGSTGPSSGYQARNWNRSVAMSIPASSWQADVPNYLYFRLYGYDYIGNMPPVFFGDYSALESLRDQQNFWRLTVNRIAWVVSLMLAVFCFFIWWHRRDHQYLYLSMSAAFASVPCLYSFSQSVPLHQETFLRIMHWCSDASAIFLILFAHQFLLGRHRQLDYWLLAGLGILIVPHSLVPSEFALPYLNSVHLLSYMLLLYMMVMAIRHFLTRRNPGALILAVGTLALWGTAIHGVSLSLSKDIARWAQEFHTNHLAMLSMLVVLIAYISKRFTLSMIGLEAMNQEMQKRVALIKAELQQGYLEHEKTRSDIELSRLRERVYRDLHDDLGARLLSLIYSADNNWRADLARSALQDLRDVVSRSKKQSTQVEAVLADCLFEQGERAQRFDVDLDWDFIPTSLLARNMEADQGLYIKQFMREFFGSLFHVDTLNEISVTVEDGQGELKLTVRAGYQQAQVKYQGLSPAVTRRLAKASGRAVLSDSRYANLFHFYFHIL